MAKTSSTLQTASQAIEEQQRRGLDQNTLRQAAIAEAHARVLSLIKAHYPAFSAAQQRRIRALLGLESAPNKGRQPKDNAPRFWLPFNGQTWSGRGRPPQAFLSWEGTVAHTAWKKSHPNERFPKFPG